MDILIALFFALVFAYLVVEPNHYINIIIEYINYFIVLIGLIVISIPIINQCWKIRNKQILKEKILDYLKSESEEDVSFKLFPDSDIQLKREILVKYDELYIEPNCKRFSNTEINDLVKYLMDSFLQPDKSKEKYLLLGDRGNGKTIILRKVLSKMGTAFKEGSSNVIPLFIEFSEVDFKNESLSQNLYQTLNKRRGLKISYEEFKQLENEYRFVFLLAGLDELSANVDSDFVNRFSDSHLFNHACISSCR